MSPPDLLPRFVVLAWDPQDEDAAGRARSLIDTLGKRAMDCVAVRTGLLLATPRSVPIDHQANAAGSLLVVGDLFDRRATEDFAVPALAIDDWPAADALATARRLLDQAWGSYIAVLGGVDGTPIVVLRDPSGGLPAWRFDAGRLHVVAEDVPRWLMKAAGVEARIDWAVMSQLLVHVPTATHRGLIAGVEKLIPGELVPLAAGSTVTSLWSPARQAGLALQPRGLQHQLRDRVSSVLAAWNHGQDSMALELSGGLDSAIVGGGLAALSRSIAPMGINYAPPFAGADERTLARRVAGQAGFHLVEVTTDPAEFRYDRLRSLPAGAEPRIAWLDMIQDEATPRIAASFGASRVMTGQGGDALFFQFPSATIVADLIHDRGLFSRWPQALIDAARRSRGSIWDGLADILRSLRPKPPRPAAGHPLVGGFAREVLAEPVARHPWEVQADHLPPGKRLQIMALAHCQLFHGPSWRAPDMRLIHPLLSQPVVELCLAIPTYDLAHGPIDRALAREAFDRWLPSEIASRSTKGDASAYYNRAVVENLAFLRSFLIDGLLVERRILDVQAVAALADEDRLMQSSDYGGLVVAASLEAWARAWC